MTKTEATIVRDILSMGRYTATTPAKANKAWEVLKEVLPHQFEVIDMTDDMGAYCQRFVRIN